MNIPKRGHTLACTTKSTDLKNFGNNVISVDVSFVCLESGAIKYRVNVYVVDFSLLFVCSKWLLVLCKSVLTISWIHTRGCNFFNISYFITVVSKQSGLRRIS